MAARVPSRRRQARPRGSKSGARGSGRPQRGLSDRDARNRACGGAGIGTPARKVHVRAVAIAVRNGMLQKLHGGVSCAMRRDDRPASRTAVPPGDAVSGSIPARSFVFADFCIGPRAPSRKAARYSAARNRSGRASG
ncbi:hypothetical protein CBM2585_B10007 [Cupriavidus taiwanensis]|nr:hypothetical protein CBM2585_B10007 [Cupriavidus taiwanensis]